MSKETGASSKGSYLNVGAMWLWNTKNEWGFNDGYRIDTDFIPFENADQFKPLIDKMSATAALEVLCLRDKFRSISQIARHLVGHSDQVGTVFHAALASALALDVETATKLFDRIRQYPSYGRPALEQWKADSAKLAALLDEPKLFYSKVFETITQVRQNLRLPPDPGCLDFMVATNEG